MKSGSLGKLTTRPNTWELLYNNPMNYVCTFDLNVVNKSNQDTSIDLVVTSIDVDILPPHEADYIFANESLNKNKSFNKKGIILGQGEKLYIRSNVSICSASAYGFIDELIVEDTTTPSLIVSCYGGNSASESNIAEFFINSKNISNGTPIDFSISDILLTRISELSINNVVVTKSLNSQFQLVNGFSRIKITLVDNTRSTIGEKITLNIPGSSIQFTKKLNCQYPVVVPTFSVLTNKTVIDEKEELQINVLTTNINDGTQLKLRLKSGSELYVNNNIIGSYTTDNYGYASVYDSTQDAVWIVHSNINKVSKIDARSGVVIGSYTVASNPVDLTYDSTNNTIWVISSDANRATKLNAATGATIGVYTLGGSDSRGIMYDKTNDVIWVSHYMSGTVTKMNVSTGDVINTPITVGTNVINTPITVGTNPRFLDYSETNDVLWVLGSNNVTKINSTTGVVMNTFPVGNSPINIAYDSIQNAFWVLNYNGISKFNADTGNLIGAYILPIGSYGLEYDKTNNVVWVSVTNSNLVYKLDAETGAIINTYPVGLRPWGLCYDHINDAVWVPSYEGINVFKLAAKSLADMNDFGATTGDLGDIVISNNRALKIIKPIDDNQTEFQESFRIELTDVNGILLATSSAIKINSK